MLLEESLARIRASAFKQSAAADLYTSVDLVDLHVVTSAAEQYASELSGLQNLLARGPLRQTDLANLLLNFPRLYGVLCAFLSISSSIELADGQRLPSPITPPRDAEGTFSVAGILLELGLHLVLNNSASVYSLFLLIQIAADAPKRRFRVDARIKARIFSAVEKAIEDASSASGLVFAMGSKGLLPLNERRIIEYVITIDGKAKFAIASTFQTHSGGRQTREMRTLYPSVHAKLLEVGVSMILVADGQGMRDLSENILAELFSAVPHTMSIGQAENGGLAAAFGEVPTTPDLPSVDAVGLRQLISGALDTGTQAQAASLPVKNETARLALANFVSTNSHLSLKLAENGVAVEWRNASLVSTFRQLAASFSGEKAAQGFALLLGANFEREISSDSEYASVVANLTDDQVFSSKFVICSHYGNADADVLREVAKRALQSSPESRVAVLVSGTAIVKSKVKELRDVQAFLPVTVVVVDLSDCVEMAQTSDSPRDRLRTLLLEQTDLTKLSPFVVRGVTPARVFFGREEEEATLLSTLSTNSVALLGGRRIGKTSLMRHSFARLTAANLRPYFGDCQVVRTWADFGIMATRNWKVSLPEAFKPQHLFDLVSQLSAGSDRPVVILLDEIDQLLDWDKSHTDDEVPEAFFRACRSISQQGLAQFVFSGERTIANRLWDATSPHWNFCRPLMLQQLGLAASNALIAEPLEALGVRIENRTEFLSACWDSTDGHPELLQFLGDKIVGLVNRRDRDDILASPADIAAITEQFDFAEQYLETYWGQASALERIVSILLVERPHSVDQLVARLDLIAQGIVGIEVQNSLRMLELYGIAEQSNIGYQLRAQWFTTALSSYGGAEMALKRYIGAISE
jgi:hypothetical protein